MQLPQGASCYLEKCPHPPHTTVGAPSGKGREGRCSRFFSGNTSLQAACSLMQQWAKHKELKNIFYIPVHP